MASKWWVLPLHANLPPEEFHPGKRLLVSMKENKWNMCGLRVVGIFFLKLGVSGVGAAIVFFFFRAPGGGNIET